MTREPGAALCTGECGVSVQTPFVTRQGVQTPPRASTPNRADTLDSCQDAEPHGGPSACRKTCGPSSARRPGRPAPTGRQSCGSSSAGTSVSTGPRCHGGRSGRQGGIAPRPERRHDGSWTSRSCKTTGQQDWSARRTMYARRSDSAQRCRSALVRVSPCSAAWASTSARNWPAGPSSRLERRGSGRGTRRRG